MCEDTLPCLIETEVGVSELGTVILLFKERGKSDQIGCPVTVVGISGHHFLF